MDPEPDPEIPNHVKLWGGGFNGFCIRMVTWPAKNCFLGPNYSMCIYIIYIYILCNTLLWLWYIVHFGCVSTPTPFIGHAVGLVSRRLARSWLRSLAKWQGRRAEGMDTVTPKLWRDRHFGKLSHGQGKCCCFFSFFRWTWRWNLVHRDSVSRIPIWILFTLEAVVWTKFWGCLLPGTSHERCWKTMSHVDCVKCHIIPGS